MSEGRKTPFSKGVFRPSDLFLCNFPCGLEGSAVAFVESAEEFVEFEAEDLNADYHAFEAYYEEVAYYEDYRVVAGGGLS